MTKINYLQTGKIKYPKSKTTSTYKKGDYISLNGGKLKIKNMNKEKEKTLNNLKESARKIKPNEFEVFEEPMEKETLLDKQLKKFDKLIISGVFNYETKQGYWLNKKAIKQFLTNFYHEIRKAEQKSKIIAIEKKMLKDSFIDDLVELRVKAERDEIIEIIRKEFYKLEEIEKDFDTNQEIIRTRNKIIKTLK